MKWTKEEIEAAVASGEVKNFAQLYRKLSGAEGKAPGGFANAVRKVVPGIFGTPSVESVESLESVETPEADPITNKLVEIMDAHRADLFNGYPVPPVVIPNNEDSQRVVDAVHAANCTCGHVHVANPIERREFIQPQTTAKKGPTPKHQPDHRHVCPKCKGYRFKTLQKGVTVKCRNCGEIISLAPPAPAAPTPTPAEATVQ